MSGAAEIRGIPEIVAMQFQITIGEMLSHRRDRRVARPRQVAMWLCQRVAMESFSGIGRYFGRDHTTVMAAIRRVDLLMAGDAALAAVVWELAGQIDPDEAVSLREVA